MEGRIKWYDKQKGYGFVSEKGKDTFFHYTGIIGDYIPSEGHKVEYEVTQGRKGEQAINITRL